MTQPQPVNLAKNADWTQGFYTPFTDFRFDPPIPRKNIRVPNFHKFWFRDGEIDPDLEGQVSPFDAPECTLRSGDTVKYPWTERLPDAEVPFILAPDAPIVHTIFKGWGVQQWQLWQEYDLPEDDYEYSIQLFPDVYFSKDGRRIYAPNPLSYEWRCTMSGLATIPWYNGNHVTWTKDHLWGDWVTLTHQFRHPGGKVGVGLEVRARWGVDVIYTALRHERLVKVSSVPVPVPAPVVDYKTELAKVADSLDALVGNIRSKLR